MVSARYSCRCVNPNCDAWARSVPVDDAYLSELREGRIACGVCGQPIPADPSIPAPPPEATPK